MADIAYATLDSASQDSEFIRRVKIALLVVAAGKFEAQPPASISTVADQEDKLARAIAADPDRYAKLYAPLVAVQLIGNTDLLDPAVTTDSALFSAVTLLYDRGLPSLA